MDDEKSEEPGTAPDPREEPDPEQSQPEAAAVEDDEESPSEPVSLHVAREIFGDLYTGQTTHGPTQFGDHNTQNNYYGKQPLDPIIGPVPGIEELLAVYVPTGADGRLRKLLSTWPVACLVGPRNSGRYSTACAALASRRPDSPIYEIELPTDVRPEALNAKPEMLPENSGFVLRLPGRGHVDAIRKLTALFGQRHSTLLLIKDEEPQRWDWHAAEVGHQAPDPIDVFRSHLTWKLPEAGRDVEAYLTDEVRAELKAVYGPNESAALASAMAEVDPDDEGAIAAILDRSQPKRRERAGAILLPSKEGSARGRRASQHERAFRLSYAVFYRRPMHYVFEAAEWLLREIDSAALRPEWGSMALQYPVHALLGDGLKDDWEAGQKTDVTIRGATRTAWIRDPGLRGAIIDVAWHDFDGTRGSLLKWLDRLVLDGDDVMRRAAAEATGLLAHHDFARVHEVLIDGWAGSRRAAVRQAAAWTMTLSDMAGDVGPKVRRKLSDWCSGSSNYQRDTAARVYASGLEQAALAWSMLDLARIAVDRLQRRRHSVALAVDQLYRPERAEWIVTELYGWSQQPLLQIHAARAMVGLVVRTAHDASDGRPELLERLAEKHVDVRHVGRLWLGAFLQSETAPAAADALVRWIRHADAYDEFRRPVAALLDAIVTTPAVRRRIEFYLEKTTELPSGLPEWIQERRPDS